MCWDWSGKWHKLTPKQQSRPSALKRKSRTHYILCVSKRFHHLRNRCEMSCAVITGPPKMWTRAREVHRGRKRAKIQVQKDPIVSQPSGLLRWKCGGAAGAETSSLTFCFRGERCSSFALTGKFNSQPSYFVHNYENQGLVRLIGWDETVIVLSPSLSPPLIGNVCDPPAVQSPVPQFKYNGGL